MPISGSFTSAAKKRHDVINIDKFSDCVENIVGKVKIARYEQFLLFPQCFHNC